MARDLRLFYLFRLLATSHLFVPIAITFFASRGLGFDRAMLLNTIWCGSVLLFDVPTGALADRIGRRRTMMLGALLMSAACLVFYFAHDFVTFAIASSLSALAMTLTSGADSAYLYDMLSDAGLEHEYPRREGTASAWHLIGSTLAFSAGGIAAKFSLGLPYLLTAGTSLCALLVAFRMREERAPATVSVSLSPRRLWRTYVSHIKMAISEISLRRQLRWTIGYSAVVFVLVRVTDYMYPPYLGAAGFGVMATGFIFAGLYLVAAAVAHNMDSLRQSLSEWRLLVGLPLVSRIGTLAACTALSTGVLLGGWFAIDPTAGYRLRIAHGSINLFGFSGLLVAGVGYYLLPRFMGQALRWPRLAIAQIIIQIAGVVILALGWWWRSPARETPRGRSPSRPRAGTSC